MPSRQHVLQFGVQQVQHVLSSNVEQVCLGSSELGCQALLQSEWSHTHPASSLGLLCAVHLAHPGLGRYRRCQMRCCFGSPSEDARPGRLRRASKLSSVSDAQVTKPVQTIV